MTKLEMFALVAYVLLFIRQVSNEREINALRTNLNNVNAALRETLKKLATLHDRQYSWSYKNDGSEEEEGTTVSIRREK